MGIKGTIFVIKNDVSCLDICCFVVSTGDSNNRILDTSSRCDEQTFVRNPRAAKIPVLIDLERWRPFKTTFESHPTNDPA